jgi:Bacterial archaeo-eukaryotic release factor family 3
MLTSDDLRSLAAVSGPCLTIYQPLRDDYSQVTKPETRIVAATQEADRLLAAKGFNPAERQEMLRPLLKVASNTDWTGRKGSLVIFRAPCFTMANFWPDPLAPRVHFAPEFLVLPLLPTLLSNRDFWLLALSINAVRLFRGSRNGLVEVALPKGVPKSLSEAGEFDQPDHSLRGRSSAGPSVGRMKGVQFGTSSAHELEADYLHDFFKAIDRGIHAALAEDRQPLILAGVARELAIYRKVNTYSPVLAGSVHGSPDAIGADVLHAKASELMSAYSARATDATLRKMEEAGSRGLLVTDPAAVIEAARLGRVEELIVSPTAPGFDQHQEAINWAALATIRNSGRVGVLKASQPAAGVAAILRFRQAEQNGDETPQYAADEGVHRQSGV